MANKKSVYENGHISGTVRPTSLQHHSNRSSLLGQPEKHLRRSLGCPGNTGEPEALENRAKKGLFWIFLPLKLSKNGQNEQKSSLFCLSHFLPRDPNWVSRGGGPFLGDGTSETLSKGIPAQLFDSPWPDNCPKTAKMNKRVHSFVLVIFCLGTQTGPISMSLCPP